MSLRFLFAAWLLLLQAPAPAPRVPWLSAHTATMRFADAETLTWNADGITLSLQWNPSPAQSLMLFRNGIVQQGGTDFTLASNLIYPIDPQPDDVYVAWYRY